MGAPIGNENRAKQYRIKRTLEACLDRRSKVEGKDALEAACDALIERSFSSLQDFKELADRLDGKAVQSTELSGPDGEPIPMQTVVNFVSPDGDGSS